MTALSTLESVFMIIFLNHSSNQIMQGYLYCNSAVKQLFRFLSAKGAVQFLPSKLARRTVVHYADFSRSYPQKKGAPVQVCRALLNKAFKLL